MSGDTSGLSEKPIGWRGTSYRDLCAFPPEARREAGHQLSLLQLGKPPIDWKPMALVGPGTIEIRVHTGTEHRIFVVSKFEEAIYVLHAFEKKSQKTSKHDVDLAKQRYRDLVAERRRQ
jgi:phage-related protein